MTTPDEAVADPGFPVGGTNFRPRCFSAKRYAKTKELGPVEGEVECRRLPLDAPL